MDQYLADVMFLCGVAALACILFAIFGGIADRNDRDV